VRKLAGNLFLDHRVWTEVLVVGLLAGVFLLATGAGNFDTTLNSGMRANLYIALSAAAGSLLGFVLAALAVLVALPSTGRIEQLQAHPQWHRVPGAYFRASRALLAALIICLVGLALDSGDKPWVEYEVAAVVAISLALVRVAASVVALDQILAVAQADQRKLKPPTTSRIDDPGP
jgi:hypothetical protein